VFFRGVDLLEAEGVNPDNLMVYMLVGYDPRETWERIWHRYTKMMERKVRPYPMVHDRFRHEKPDLWKKLKRFQGWIIRGRTRRVRSRSSTPATSRASRKANC
jgi:hypothetical protein